MEIEINDIDLISETNHHMKKKEDYRHDGDNPFPNRTADNQSSNTEMHTKKFHI